MSAKTILDCKFVQAQPVAVEIGTARPVAPFGPLTRDEFEGLWDLYFKEYMALPGATWESAAEYATQMTS